MAGSETGALPGAEYHAAVAKARESATFRVDRLAEHVDRLANLLAGPTSPDEGQPEPLLTRAQVRTLRHLAHEVETLTDLYGPTGY